MLFIRFVSIQVSHRNLNFFGIEMSSCHSCSSLPLINLCTNVWGIYVIFVVLIVNLSSENFIGKSLVACINWRAGWTWTAMLDTCKGWWQVLSTSCSHWGSLKGGCCFNAANYTLLCWPNSRLWYIDRAISIHHT